LLLIFGGLNNDLGWQLQQEELALLPDLLGQLGTHFVAYGHFLFFDLGEYMI